MKLFPSSMTLIANVKHDIWFSLIQYRWFRKWKGGTYYLNYNWVTLPFWNDKIITSCGGRSIKIEKY